MDIEGFFLPKQNLPFPSQFNLSDTVLSKERFDLSVYHLAYGTKPLRKCTIRRMAKRQSRINMRKAQKLIVLTPEQKEIKAEKQKWLEKMMEKAKVENEQFLEPKQNLLVKRTLRRLQFDRRRKIIVKSHQPVVSKQQSNLGLYGKDQKIVKVKNTPFTKSDWQPTPSTEFSFKNNKPAIKGYDNPSDFPSLL